MNSPVDLDEQLGNEITLLAGQINAASYQLLKLIARFDDAKAWSCGGTVRSCAHWLNWKCGIALGAAREKVRVAHALEILPLIDQSFSTGQISYSKVRAMSRVATPENEDYLLMVAQHGTASHMERVVGKYQKVQRSIDRQGELDQTESDQQKRRELVAYQGSDDMWVIHARLPAEEGSLVVKALEAVARPIQEEKQAVRKRELESERNGDVSAEILSEPDDRSLEGFPQVRADALVVMAEHFLATKDGSGDIQSLKGNDRCQIVLHVDIDTLRAPSSKAKASHSCCNLDNKQWISPKTAKRLSCDASLVTVLEDETGKVLNIGRRARTIPAAISRALSVRDECCRFPGCCETRYVDAHHIEHWADGGETSLDNLVTLCRYHHRQLHQGNYTISLEQTNAEKAEPLLVFLTSTGKRIETSLFPQFPAQALGFAEEEMNKLAPEVDSNTCVTQWRGEACDYGMAIAGLLHRDRERC